MGWYNRLNKYRKGKVYNIITRDKVSEYLIYERKYTESGLSRWLPLCSSGDFGLKDENITILQKNILSINIEGIKLSKDNAEMWLMYNGKMMRNYTEKSKHRLHWIKLTYAGKFKKGDILTIGSDGIGDIQVTIICLD